MGSSVFPILAQFTPLEHERFAAHRQLEARLRSSLEGEVHFDLASRAMFAADASNYRQLPVGVVYPRHAADVEAALAACRAAGAAVLPRGAGTSLAGQCANVAVVFDFSRFMHQLVSLDPAARLAVVQPGLVLDRLRDAAELHHLTYAPDPATHSRCTLGGMIGNNSCGVHGLLPGAPNDRSSSLGWFGGKTVDNVESLDIVLYDGTRLTVGRTSQAELEEKIRSGGRIGEIYSALAQLRDRYADLVRQKFPRIPRRVSGYNLDELLPENGFHVARALVGSEGTCATVVSATLNLTASPPFRVLTVLGFSDPFLAADSVPLALAHKPIGLEGFDHLLVEFMRRKGLALRDLENLPPGVGFLLVESGAWTAEEAQAKAEQLARDSQSWPHPPHAHICTPAQAAAVWHVRESALGAVVCVPGEPGRWEGWEDAAVPPARLGEYLRRITALMAQYGYTSPLYGHYGQGCVHMRINFDFDTDQGLRDFREFLNRAADVVIECGGSLSGEHGDGQARAALLPKMFGPELIQAFRAFKAIWDPDNRMNPGKLIDAARVYDPLENLRHHPPAPASLQGRAAQSDAPEVLATNFAFAADSGSFQHATERCVGVGACRKASGGVMCPSYRATGQEQHSTRGRARLLWEMLAGDLRVEGLQSPAIHEALDLCLSCKACKTECPVQVDMAACKSEFLAQSYSDRLHPLHHYVFGYADKLARLGSLAPAVTNALLTGPVTSPLLKRIAGIAPQRTLPRLAPKSFQSSRAHQGNKSRREAQSPAPEVLLWPDTWNNYYHPQILAAAETILAAAGFRVVIPRGHLCCGRPLYDFGLLDSARAYLARVLDRMTPFLDAGLPIIFLEPSCASVFKDELPELFPGNARAEHLRENIWLLADWLAAHAPNFADGTLAGAQILLHGHCHHKAVFGGPQSEIEILRRAGANVQPIQSGCCGMAGPFGFEAGKFEVSKAIAEDGLLPAVRAASPTTILVADGFSCREQIQQLGHAHALHFVEVLARTCGCGG
ncbi:MAG TPA: FAD-linked oxidase C-terminal domain-containing protein [Terracidiphilus sp.]|nr:FAD-linked oxidase C-terminal domain-containing protein [Terracidiphilus sp.]